jgi:septum formation protein
MRVSLHYSEKSNNFAGLFSFSESNKGKRFGFYADLVSAFQYKVSFSIKNHISMLDNLRNFSIILGSASPRRNELLSGLGIDFKVQTIDVEETYPDSIPGISIPMYLAEKKADAFADYLNESHLLITADTIVLLDNQVLGKPTDREDAKRMLKQLSGNNHQVITGVCISTADRRKTFHTVSEVRFAELHDDEIEYYLDHFKPYDKAGSYGIQEWIGYIGVEQITGSFYNVMGLPVQRLYCELKKW